MNESPTNWGKHHNWNWNGLCCHWRVLGELKNQPIVLIHGFGASSDHWRHNAEDFVQAGFCVYGIDLIGFGQSEQPSPKKINSLENKFWADQLTSFLEQIVLPSNPNKAILVGNSLGGLVALTTIAIHPELVQAIIASPLPDPAFIKKVQSSSPKNEWKRKAKEILVKLFFNLLPLEILIPIISRTNLIYKALQLAYFHSISLDKDLKRLVREPAKKTSAARALRSMCIGMSLRSKSSTAPSLLNRLSKNLEKPPILLLWGREDKLVPLSIGENLIKQHSWIKLLVIENCGHCPHDESSKHFNNLVLNWLEINLKTYSKKA